MATVFDDDAFEQLMYWMRENRKTADKIHNLIKDIRRNGLKIGIVKPEKLKCREAWSRRIDHENRLVYDVDENGNIRILSYKGHYND